LPVFNGEKYIAAAIKSVLNQSFHNIELLVIDDGSRDNTREIVSKFNDVRVHYIYQANKGPASARNNGIERARGDYLAFIDYDDTWYKDKLCKQLEYLKASPFLSAVYCKHSLVFEDPRKNYEWVKEIEHQKRYTCEIPSSLLVKKELFDRVGKFDDGFRNGEDVDFYLRLNESSLKYEVMDLCLFDKLIHDDNMSKDIERNRKYMFQALAISIKRKKEYDNIKISVIITAYNSTDHLIDCLNSVFNQTFQPFEIIVIDDGSTNNTKELVLNYGDERIKYYYQEHQGISVARNAGILNSSGNYIAYMDHDDLWPENKLKLQIERLIFDKSVNAVFGLVSQFYSPEVDIEYRNKYICPQEPSSARHLGTLLIKKDDFYRVGVMDESVKIGEGLDWISRFDKIKLSYAIIPEILLFRRMHYNNYGIRFKNNRSDYGKVFAKIIREKKNAKD
jgi:glycosyltransferase involved in cell wall biosynthesis